MIDFKGDSGEYDFLTLGVELSKDVDGLCLENGHKAWIVSQNNT
jgi:hypothetical protein